ncbi:MAG: SpaH/EbpB family LPXTG-anchored major pilin [Fastidiosipilaceae bacterium]
MKKVKKLASLLIALLMVFAMASTASADAPTGSITITDSSTVSVEKKTFNAYKILDLELVGTDGYVYTVPDAMKSFYANYFTIDATAPDFSGQVRDKIATMNDNSDELFAFASAALSAAKTAGITPGSATGADGANSVTIENLPLGYYVVEDAGTAIPISALMLQSTDPDVEVVIKADEPTIEKEIVESNGTSSSNNAAVGDQVDYKLGTKVPNMVGYTKYYFVVNDTLSKGLTFNNDVKIMIGTATLVNGTDYVVTTSDNSDGTTGIKIVFNNFIQHKNKTYQDIVITYSATVNQHAVIGINPNTNEVDLTYSNDPNGSQEGENEPEPGDAAGETPKSKTYTYVTGLELIKVDPAGKPLTGAVFQIEGKKLNHVLVETEVFTEDAGGEYWKLKDGTYTMEAPVTDESAPGYNADKYESVTTKYKKTKDTNVVETSSTVKATGTVGADGVLRFNGLAAGDYTITEIKAPDGYNLLTNPINVKITWGAPATGKTECTWTFDGADLVDPGIGQITIVNKAGAELPSTGGVGTTIFYVVGAILAVGAVILLVTKKRMSAK